MTPDPPSANESNQESDGSDLDDAVKAWAEKGIAIYLEDADLAAEVIEWLHKETGINRTSLRFGLKLLSPLVTAATEKGQSWLNDFAKRRLKNLIRKLPYYESLTETITGLASKIDSQIAAKAEVKAVLNGKRPAHTLEAARSLSLDLQAHIKTIQALENVETHLAEGFSNIERLLNPQPQLHVPVLPLEPSNRFFYGALRVPIVGRDADLESVTGFAYSGATFAWWMIVGPAGLGKSRIALEFCLRNAMSWHTGFLAESFGSFSWATWQPDAPTFLISDYASSKAKELRALILTLHERRDLVFPVRLLLLERQVTEPWWSYFIGSGSDRHIITSVKYLEPLALRDLTDEDLWIIVETILRESRRPLPEPGPTIQILKRLDPNAKPLSAALFADALADGRNPKNWDHDFLLNDFLLREEQKYWAPSGVTETDKNLLALVTLCGGLELDIIASSDAEGFLPSRNDFQPDRYSILCGRPSNEFLYPLEPDVMGEFFVLEYVKPRHKLDTDRAAQLISMGLRLGTKGLFQFVIRAAFDFPSHQSLRLLEKPFESTEDFRRLWSQLAISLTAIYQRESLPFGQKILSDLRALSSRNPHEGHLQEAVAQAAFNVIKSYADAGYLQKAELLYKDPSSFPSDRPDQPSIRIEQCRAAVNLISDFGNARDIRSAKRLYSEVSSMAEKYPAEIEIAEQKLRGLGNLIHAYHVIDQADPVHNLYMEMKQLVLSYSSEPLFREFLAAAAKCALSNFAKIDAGSPAVNEAFDELRQLCIAYPNEPALRGEFGDAVISLAGYLGDQNQVSQARVYYDELCRLVQQHPNDLRLLQTEASAALNLIIDFAKSQDASNVQSLYQRVSQLSREHPNEPTIRETKAKAAVHVIAAQSRSGDADIAQAIYDELKFYAQQYPSDAVLRSEMAQGAINLIGVFSKTHDVSKSQAIYGELKDFAERFPLDGAMRSCVAGGAVNLVPILIRSGDIAAACEIGSELAMLSEQFKIEEFLQKTCAMAFLNLIAALCGKSEFGRAEAIFESILAVSSRCPHDDEIGLMVLNARHLINAATNN